MSDDRTDRPRAVRYRDAHPTSRRRFRVIVLVMSIIVVAGLLVVGDLAIRAYAEDRVASEIESRLPDQVEGDVDVSIGGFSVVAQYLTGRFDDVRLVSEGVTVAGVPVEADITLNGVPVDTSQPVEHAEGAFSLDQDAVASLLASQGIDGAVTFDGGLLRYEADTLVFGQTLTVGFTATPSIDGGRIVFTPDDASVSAGGVDLDLDALFPVLAPEGLAICVAQYLPSAIALGDVAIADGHATVSLTAENLPLTESALRETGTC
jgi:hypothetical protein